MTDSKIIGKPLANWVEEVNTIVVDKAFYEGIDKNNRDSDAVFLSEKESKMVGGTDELFKQERMVYLSMSGLGSRLKKEAFKIKVERLRKAFAREYNKNIAGKNL